MDLIAIERGLHPYDRRKLERGYGVIVPAFSGLCDEERAMMLHTLRFLCATRSNAGRYATVRDALRLIAEHAPPSAGANRAMTALRAILDYQTQEETEPRPDLVATLQRLKKAKCPQISVESFLLAMRNAECPGNKRMAHWLSGAFEICEKKEIIAH